MATFNKKIRRVVSGVANIVHLETVKAQIKQTSAGADRSTFSKNLFGFTHDVAADKYLKITTGGVINKVNTPADFGAAAETHPHDKSDISAAEFSASTSYVLGAYVTYSGTLYRFNAAHSAGPWTGSDVTEISTSYANIDDLLNDNMYGKVPLVGGNIPDIYFPTYTQGHMKYVGAADLTAGVDVASAVNVTALTAFAELSTNPLQKLGNFCIVSVAGYVKADGVPASGTGFVNSLEEGPIHLSVGDRIIFAAYNAVGPTYTFALMHNDYRVANTSRLGVVALADGLATDRGALAVASSGSNVIDEYALKQAMRDIIYDRNNYIVSVDMDAIVLDTVQVPDRGGNVIIILDTSVITNKPTHSSGDADITVVGNNSYLPDAWMANLTAGVLVFVDENIYRIRAIAGDVITYTFVGPTQGISTPLAQWATEAGHVLFVKIFSTKDMYCYEYYDNSNGGYIYYAVPIPEGDLIIS